MTSTPLKTSDISIIIPTLNEEANIKLLPQNLRPRVGEVIVVDGDSQDDTIGAAREKGFQVFSTSSGRASQLNLGIMHSSGSILLFLHADTLLPENFGPPILNTLKHNHIAAGAFGLSIRDASATMAFVAHCANIRSRLFELPYGDQAIFIKKETCHKVGCFPSLPIMEDYVFIKKVKKLGQVHTLPLKVSTSARRWQRLGVIRTTLINQIIVLGYSMGIKPETLASLYRR